MPDNFHLMLRRNRRERACSFYDATTDARMMMSAILRTGETHQSHVIIDILVGETSDLKLSELETFGVGRHTPRNVWFILLHQFRQIGLLAVRPRSYALVINRASNWRQVLRDEEKVLLDAEPLRAEEAKRTEDALTEVLSARERDIKGRPTRRVWDTKLTPDDMEKVRRLRAIITGEQSHSGSISSRSNTLWILPYSRF